MKDDVLQRVILFFNTKNISETAFAKRIGSNQKTLNQQLKGERSISIDTVLNIISSFDEVSPDWLLTGKGEMLKRDNNVVNTGNVSGNNSGINVAGSTIQGNVGGSNNNISLVLPEKGYQKIIDSTGKETIIRLSDDSIGDIEMLSSENQHLKNTISRLEEKIKLQDELLKSKEEIINMYKLLKSVDRRQ